MAPPGGRPVPDISVVVCTHNRAAKLRTCLAALGRQTLGTPADIVVVDDGSTDATAAVLEAAGVRWVRHPDCRGLAAARNTGAEVAVAPIVAFTDDDCVPADDWLEQLLAGFAEPDVVAVGGAVHALAADRLHLRYLAANNPLAPLELDLGAGGSIPYRVWLYAKRQAGIGGRHGRRSVFALAGANMAVRREAIQALGGFDPRATFGGEDEDLYTRLRRRFPAGRLLFVPEAAVAHDYEVAVRDSLRRAYAYGKGSARNFLRHPEVPATVFPVPPAILALAAAGLRRPAALLVAAALPLAAYSRWGRLAARSRSLEPLTYAYLQVAQEAAHDLAFARMLATHVVRRRHEARPQRAGP